MTAETEQTDVTSETEDTTTTTTTDQGENRQNDVTAMERSLKKANKEAEALRLKVKEFEDLSKTEQEKLTEKLTGMQRDLGASTLTASRYEVALEKGLTLTQAKRLVGNNRDELLADADELIKDLGARRVPSFDGGARDGRQPSDGSFLTQAIRDRRR